MAVLFQINDCVYYPGASAFSELEVKTAPVHSSSEEVAACEILSEAVHTSYFMPKSESECPREDTHFHLLVSLLSNDRLHSPSCQKHTLVSSFGSSNEKVSPQLQGCLHFCEND